MITQTPFSNLNTKELASLGSRLKSARQDLAMERKDAAAQLRLQENIIVMIEDGHFKSDLPLTFIRGYIRSYSKLLNIPESELREALESIEPQPLIIEDNLPTSLELKPASNSSNAHSSDSNSPVSQLSASTLSGIPLSGIRLGNGASRNNINSDYNFNLVLKLTKKFKLNKFMQFFALMIIVSLLGLGSAWWYQNNIPSILPNLAKNTAVSQGNSPTQNSAQTSVTANPEEFNAQPSQLEINAGLNLDANVNLETLAPSSNLNAVLLANIKIYTLQAMVNQLTDYIDQAAAVKFDLTDKSTAIGSFTYKKKSRRHAAVNYDDENYDNNNENNNSDNNSKPPYYYNYYNQ
jgi:cytoskeletal protein RodZ